MNQIRYKRKGTETKETKGCKAKTKEKGGNGVDEIKEGAKNEKFGSDKKKRREKLRVNEQKE